MITQLRYGTPTSQWFWGYDDSNTGGVFGVYLDGVYHAGSTMTSDNGYTGRVQVTGITPGAHTYQGALAGVALGETYTFNTAPSASESVRVAVWGCAGRVVDGQWVFGDNSGFDVMRRMNLDAHVSLGDFYYIAPAYNCLDAGVIRPTSGTGIYATELPKYRKNYQYQAMASINRQRLMANLPFVGMYDNHEVYSGGIISQNGGPTVGGTTTVLDAAHEMADAFFLGGRPPCVGSSDTLPTINGGPFYTSWQWGPVQFILLDRIAYAGSTVFSLGANQIAWFQATVAASTADFLVVLSPTSFRNLGGLTDYNTLLGYLDAAPQTCAIVSSDMHYAVAEFIQGSLAPTKGVLQVMGNPVRNQKSGYTPTLPGNSTALFNSNGERTDSFTLVECDGETLTLSIINSWNGSTMASFAIPRGQRQPQITTGVRTT